MTEYNIGAGVEHQRAAGDIFAGAAVSRAARHEERWACRL